MGWQSDPKETKEQMEDKVDYNVLETYISAKPKSKVALLLVPEMRKQSSVS